MTTFQPYHWPSALLWGFISTLILTSTLSAGRGLGLTRMDIPYMLGTIFTADRDRAKWIGFVVHLLNGLLFALLYVAALITSGHTTWWFGALLGVMQSFFVLTIGMALLPAVHPRMASEEYGPDPTQQLEPPGFMALNYGRQTPIATVISHVIYGVVIGLFYR